MSAADIVFMDTETLGLDPEAPIWEFAAIRRDGTTGAEELFHCFIDHDAEPWFDSLEKPFQMDYLHRYVAEQAISRADAAAMIFAATDGAHMVACNPVFDDPRVAALLRRCGIEPAWHYHPDDISSVAKGYLAARGELPSPPWKSEGLSRAIGINPQNYERHTAMGDSYWVRDQYDRIMPAAKAGV